MRALPKGKYSKDEDKLPYFNQLKEVLQKETLKDEDYSKIKETLGKIADAEISDERWSAIKEYIEIEHRKWLHVKVHAKKKEQASNETTNTVSTLSINPTNYLPIQYQPWFDINWRLSYSPVYGWVWQGGNSILKGYYYLWTISGGYAIELTFVLADEDHPDPTLDVSYDIVRLAQWGRIEDIETFYLYTNSYGNPTWIYFCYNGGGTHSRSQTFNVLYPTHYCDWVSASSFGWSGNRPRIYINTWNHLFGEYDTNPSLSDKIWDSYPTKQGTRVTAEQDY